MPLPAPGGPQTWNCVPAQAVHLGNTGARNPRRARRAADALGRVPIAVPDSRKPRSRGASYRPARMSSPLAAVACRSPATGAAAPSLLRSTRAARCGGTCRGWRPRNPRRQHRSRSPGPGCEPPPAARTRVAAGGRGRGRRPGEQPRELRPRRIRVAGIDVVGPLEACDGFRNRRGAPAEIPDAPAHHEVDVLPAARVGEDAAVRGGNLQLRWELPGERLAASSGHETTLPCARSRLHRSGDQRVRGHGAHRRDHPPTAVEIRKNSWSSDNSAGYSSRNASTGATLDARSAGSSDAASAVARNIVAATSSVRGSPGAMP